MKPDNLQQRQGMFEKRDKDETDEIMEWSARNYVQVRADIDAILSEEDTKGINTIESLLNGLYMRVRTGAYFGIPDEDIEC